MQQATPTSLPVRPRLSPPVLQRLTALRSRYPASSSADDLILQALTELEALRSVRCVALFSGGEETEK